MLQVAEFPAPLPLKHLLAHAPDADASDAVDLANMAELTLADQSEPTSRQLTPKPRAEAVDAWLRSVLEGGGVVCALPKELFSTTDEPAHSALARTGQLHGRMGKGAWWLQELQAVNLLGADAARSTGHLSAVHNSDSLDTSNEWFPEASDLDSRIVADEWDRVAVSGFSVAVTQRRASVDEPGGDLLSTVALEAAANGLAPAIFAAMLLKPRHTVVVTQLQSFMLGDMLAAYNRALADPLRRPAQPAFDGTLFEATAAIARRVRALADLGILKLNMSPSTIVFCPRLSDGIDGELQESGYGYAGMRGIRGQPRFVEFDPQLTIKFSRHQTADNADCSYLLMMLVLLASVKAEYASVFRVMLNKVNGLGPDGRVLPEDELPPRFEEDISMAAAARRCRTDWCSTESFCATLPAECAEVAQDLKSIIRSRVAETAAPAAAAAPAPPRDRPIFASLIKRLTCSTRVETDLFAAASSADHEVARFERVEAVAQRLSAVRDARRVPNTGDTWQDRAHAFCQV
jgi:hypothetical protein